MSKRGWTWVAIAGVIIAGYFLYRWYRSQQTAGTSPTGSFGSNLNSVAPELVGGSSGPSLGPAVSLPVNISLTESVPSGAAVTRGYPQSSDDSDKLVNPKPVDDKDTGGKDNDSDKDDEDVETNPGTPMIPSNVTTNIPMNTAQSNGAGAASLQPDMSPGVTQGVGT